MGTRHTRNWHRGQVVWRCCAGDPLMMLGLLRNCNAGVLWLLPTTPQPLTFENTVYRQERMISNSSVSFAACQYCGAHISLAFGSMMSSIFIGEMCFLNCPVQSSAPTEYSDKRDRRLASLTRHRILPLDSRPLESPSAVAKRCVIRRRQFTALKPRMLLSPRMRYHRGCVKSSRML